ncbi:Transmembrane protein [Phytophthora cinnamomi]|uniref:Transmembrane protein n=1 Tax=Phytophthora cinnamomi TaxID=4785 RepID=UPI00355A7732|nr:Transmembrane protein [Phytophthora cinnamomi]
MAVGMTLNQLYAPPPPSSSAGSAPPSSQALSPPQGRSPKTSAGLQLPAQPQPQMDRVYQMPPYAQQPFTPAASSSGLQYQPLTKAGPSTSEDYAADPLPFEYSRSNGSGRYPRDDASSRTSSAYADSYGSSVVYTQTQQRLSPYSQAYPEPRGYHHDPMQPQFPTRATQMYAPMGGSMLPLPTHAFPPLLDVTKKEVDAYPSQYTSSSSSAAAAPSSSSAGTAQEAMIKVKTPLKLKYWRNGRRNLQCFPSCKVFGDYSAIKIEDLKQHDFMWGKCRGSLVTEVTLNSNVTFDDLVLLGRVHSLENIPVAFEEAVIRECMLGRSVEADEMDAMKDQWITGERLPDFVQQDGNVACFEFKPKVWKYTEDMAQGKCKRRNVKYYVQFEAFVQMVAGDRRYFACIGSGMSTSFEVGSSRVLARQKRKAASSAADAAKKNPQGDMAALQPQQLMAHNGNPLIHSVMATHPMVGSNPM